MRERGKRGAFRQRRTARSNGHLGRDAVRKEKKVERNSTHQVRTPLGVHVFASTSTRSHSRQTNNSESGQVPAEHLSDSRQRPLSR
jgi:hypothetical protein